MVKKFNTTGKCNAAQHYMADVSHKLAQTIEMVEDGRYFVISRPRQSGKTTFLHTLANEIRRVGVKQKKQELPPSVKVNKNK